MRISPNTPDAVTSTATTPTSVAVAPEVESLGRSRIELMKSPPQQPAKLRTDRGTGGILPESQAAMATTMRSTGASDVAA